LRDEGGEVLKEHVASTTKKIQPCIELVFGKMSGLLGKEYLRFLEGLYPKSIPSRAAFVRRRLLGTS
jgi:hypothetical protein